MADSWPVTGPNDAILECNPLPDRSGKFHGSRCNRLSVSRNVSSGKNV